jgi:EAL domain-containing protein (putative c-di-GMP-specific phosphodiesterase class I)
VSPGEFIPVAEETGAIGEIGLWIVAEACRAVRQWPDGVYVAVNVSPVQLACGDFAERMMEILEGAGIDPGRFEIELTETALAEDGEPIAASLRTLRARGIRVAMDDFGTGYSSLAHLRRFDLDCIKIDLSFVQTAPFDPAAAAVLHAVVQLAEGLGVGTVGEGVETEEQLAMLRKAGCQVAQGYLLGRPMTGAQALALCRAETGSAARRTPAEAAALG